MLDIDFSLIYNISINIRAFCGPFRVACKRLIFDRGRGAVRSLTARKSKTVAHARIMRAQTIGDNCIAIMLMPRAVHRNHPSDCVFCILGVFCG